MQPMKKDQNNNLLAGAGLLTLTGLIAKILSALYRIPLQNLVGNRGFYVYQQVYPIYGIGVVLALSGWPLVISKLVSEQPDEAHARFMAQRLHHLLTIISLFIFGCLMFGAPLIAEAMGGDLALTPVIKAVAWMFLLMPLLATARGYSQGQFNMTPTAISQIVEQIVRVSVIVLVAIWASQQHWSVYKMGTWAMAGAPIATVFASVFILKKYREIYMIKKVDQEQFKHATQFQWRILARRMWQEGGLLVLVAALLVLFQLVDAFTVKSNLVLGGMNETQAENLKGVYDRGQPLVQLGMVLATSIGTTLVPNLRHYFVTAQTDKFEKDFASSMRLSILLILATTSGMLAVLPQLNQSLFGSREATFALGIYLLSMLPATLILVLITILQSINQTRHIMIAIFVGILLKWGMNDILMQYIGLDGASWSTVLGLLFILCYTIRCVPKNLWLKLELRLFLTKSLGLSGIMLALVWLIELILESILGNQRVMVILILMLGVLFGIIIFVGGSLKWQILKIDEINLLPKGSKISEKIYRK